MKKWNEHDIEVRDLFIKELKAITIVVICIVLQFLLLVAITPFLKTILYPLLP